MRLDVPLLSRRIEDLGSGDFVWVQCLAWRLSSSARAPCQAAGSCRAGARPCLLRRSAAAIVKPPGGLRWRDAPLQERVADRPSAAQCARCTCLSGRLRSPNGVLREISGPRSQPGETPKKMRGRNYQYARCRRLAALSPEWLRTIGPFAFYIDQCALFFAKSLPQAGGWLRRYARRGCGISE